MFIIISAKALIMFKIAGLNDNEIDYGVFGSSLEISTNLADPIKVSLARIFASFIERP